MQTPSDYDTLFAKAFPDEWARVHQPVLSRRSHDPARYTQYSLCESGKKPELVPITRKGTDDHILITKFNFAEPAGLLVPCVLGCAWPMNTAATAAGIRVRCGMCGSKTTIPRHKSDLTTRLG